MTQNEGPEQLARRMFKLTIAGTCAFVVIVLLVLRFVPSNDGVTPAPDFAPTPTRLAAR